MSDRTVEVRKLGYSRSPWRLVDSETGKEVAFERETLDHPDLGAMFMPKAGYDTKTEAVAALGRLAAQTLDEPDRELVCCDECYGLGKRFDGITTDPVPMTDEEFDEFMDAMGRGKR